MTPDTVRAVEKGLVALLIGLYACAMALALGDALGRVGAPDIGWMMDGPRVAPTLGADVLLPLVRDSRVIGALALGHRTTGDVYETADLDALATVAQQAVQAIARVEATERLRTRETEFADLKRFFPPQIIDQVMARGGAAELQSQRKLVTVVFADLRGFTTFSDTDLAARLSDAAAGGEVLISARVGNALSDGYETAAVGELALKGFRQAQAVYRLVYPNGA